MSFSRTSLRLSWIKYISSVFFSWSADIENYNQIMDLVQYDKQNSIIRDMNYIEEAPSALNYHTFEDFRERFVTLFARILVGNYILTDAA